MLKKIRETGIAIDNSIRANITKRLIKSNLSISKWIHIVYLRWLKKEKAWVFDIPFAGIVNEPFGDGMPELIEHHLNRRKGKLAHAKKYGVCVLFSHVSVKPSEFSDGIYTKLTSREEDNGGCWYWDVIAKKYGWLCPNLHQFFTSPPQQIHFCLR